MNEVKIKSTLLEDSILEIRDAMSHYFPKLTTIDACFKMLDDMGCQDDWPATLDGFLIMEEWLSHLRKNACAIWSKETVEKFLSNVRINETIELNSALMIKLIADSYSGNNFPKLFKPDDILWNKLVNTDLKGITIADIKIPFDTLILEIPKIDIKISCRTAENVSLASRLHLDFLNNTDNIEKTSIDAYIDSFIITSDGTDFHFYIGLKYPSLKRSGVNSIYSQIMEFHLTFSNNKITDELSVLIKKQAYFWNELIDDDDIKKIFNNIILGTMNFILYINSYNDCIKKIPKKNSQIFKNSPKTFSFETFFVDSPKVIKINKSSNPSSKTESFSKTCPKWDVRGHWRKQPCGKNKTESKIIWIQPFTKGEFRHIGIMPASRVYEIN